MIVHPEHLESSDSSLDRNKQDEQEVDMSCMMLVTSTLLHLFSVLLCF